MGARPSSYKQGGGRFNGKAGTIEGYEFIVRDPVEIKKGDRKGEYFTPLDLVFQFLMDGATEATPKQLQIGEATDFGDVSEDGLTLATPEGQNLRSFCEAGIFLTSLVHPEEGDGFPEDRLSDSEEEINYEPIIGTRVEFAEVENQWAKDNGKKQVNKKTKKEYKILDLKVAKVLELPAVKGKATAKAAVKPVVKGKPAPVEEEDNSDAVATAASEAFARYIAKEPGKVIKIDKLRMKVVTDPAFKRDATLRDAVIEIAEDADALAALGGVDYDAKKKTLKIAA